jgi:hypothetical protein
VFVVRGTTRCDIRISLSHKSPWRTIHAAAAGILETNENLRIAEDTWNNRDGIADERCAADAERDIRGLALGLAGEGNWGSSAQPDGRSTAIMTS